MKTLFGLRPSRRVIARCGRISAQIPFYAVISLISMVSPPLAANSDFSFGPVFPSSISCPTCMTMASMPLVQSPVAGVGNDLTRNVSGILAMAGDRRLMGSALQFSSFNPAHPSVAQMQASMPGFVATNWDGTGELPGAFHRPWELSSASNFTPKFILPQWVTQMTPQWDQPLVTPQSVDPSQDLDQSGSAPVALSAAAEVAARVQFDRKFSE